MQNTPCAGTGTKDKEMQKTSISVQALWKLIRMGQCQKLLKGIPPQQVTSIVNRATQNALKRPLALPPAAQKGMPAFQKLKDLIAK